MAGQAGVMQASRLDNGVHVLTEAMKGVRSVAVGIWLRQGSACETPVQMGISHLLEHMVFKGTLRRSAKDIALALESLGGSLDAYTGREQTSFQARVLDAHLPDALDVLADLVRNPRLRASDLRLEKDVVLEEIAMVEDTPDDLVFELHGRRLWGRHPYGNSILGTRDSVLGLSVEDLRRLHGARYVGANLIVGAAGNVSHTEIVGRAQELFGDLPPGDRTTVPDVGREMPPGEHWTERPGAQAHVVFGTRIPPHSDPVRYPLIILSCAMGGGMSSRLFQRIREEMALCYTVFSYQSFYSRAGVSGVYLGTRPEWAGRAVDAVRAELRSAAREGLTREELERTKRQVKGQLMLALEAPGSRLHRLAAFALYGEPFATLDEVMARVDAVTLEHTGKAAARYLDPERYHLLTLGPRPA